MTRWLRYWARTVRPEVADPLAQLAFAIRWERGEIGGGATLPYSDFTISGAIDQSEHVLCDGKHVEARNLTGSSV